MRRLRVCIEAGCSTLTQSTRCPEHERQRRTVANVANLHGLYRTKRWQDLREQKMRENPFCCDCEAQGVKRVWDELDHQQPHCGDLVLFWDPENLRGRCREHHGMKTRRGE
jgi:5-methylcytosine-specific restriction protein A